ncbi:MAG: hypothetical protein ACOYOB_12970 [Myxococcota bacterium]
MGTKTVLCGLAFVATCLGASPAWAAFVMSANVQGGLTYNPSITDPGLNRMIDRYNSGHPTLTRQMPHITSNSGYNLGISFNISASDDFFQEGSVTFMHLASPFAHAEGVQDGQAVSTDLRVVFDGGMMTWAGYVPIMDRLLIVGPEIGFILGGQGVEVGSQGMPVADSATHYGLHGSLNIGLNLAKFELPFYIVARVHYRKMMGYGYADISEALTPESNPWAVLDLDSYRSDYSNVGVNVSIAWVFGAEGYTW